MYTIVNNNKNVTTVDWFENLRGVKFANILTAPTIMLSYVSSLSIITRHCMDKIDSVTNAQFAHF